MIELGPKIKAWTEGVPLDPKTFGQVKNISTLPIIEGHVAVMPDAHFGIGACVGTVIPTRGALIPAAVGVDIGCGMSNRRLDLKAETLVDLPKLRLSIERSVPVGSGKHGEGDFFEDKLSAATIDAWKSQLESKYLQIIEQSSKVAPRTHPIQQLGTLGGGNHFIEIVRDQEGYLGIMLHSGSRGIGNRIGQYFIERARTEAEIDGIRLVDRDLAWLSEKRPSFQLYVEAMMWAQTYARLNRELMMANVYDAFAHHIKWPAKPKITMQVNCHHNFTEQASTTDRMPEGTWITRKGAVRARAGDFVIPLACVRPVMGRSLSSKN